MYNRINTINTAVRYVWKLLRVNLEFSLQGKTFFFCFFNFTSIREDGYSLNFLWSSLRDINKSNHYATPQTYTVLCVNYISIKLEEKTNKKKPKQLTITKVLQRVYNLLKSLYVFIEFPPVTQSLCSLNPFLNTLPQLYEPSWSRL